MTVTSGWLCSGVQASKGGDKGRLKGRLFLLVWEVDSFMSIPGHVNGQGMVWVLDWLLSHAMLPWPAVDFSWVQGSPECHHRGRQSPGSSADQKQRASSMIGTRVLAPSQQWLY